MPPWRQDRWKARPDRALPIVYKQTGGRAALEFLRRCSFSSPLVFARTYTKRLYKMLGGVLRGLLLVTVAASAGSVVLYKLDEGTFTVADPTQQLVQVELSVRSSGLGLQPKGVENGRAMSVVLPSGGSAGQSTTHRM